MEQFKHLELGLLAWKKQVIEATCISVALVFDTSILDFFNFLSSSDDTPYESFCLYISHSKCKYPLVTVLNPSKQIQETKQISIPLGSCWVPKDVPCTCILSQFSIMEGENTSKKVETAMQFTSQQANSTFIVSLSPSKELQLTIQ